MIPEDSPEQLQLQVISTLSNEDLIRRTLHGI